MPNSKTEEALTEQNTEKIRLKEQAWTITSLIWINTKSNNKRIWQKSFKEQSHKHAYQNITSAITVIQSCRHFLLFVSLALFYEFMDELGVSIVFFLQWEC